MRGWIALAAAATARQGRKTAEDDSARENELQGFDSTLVVETSEVHARRKRCPVRVGPVPANLMRARGLRTLDQAHAQSPLQVEDSEMNGPVVGECEGDRGRAAERVRRGFLEQRNRLEPSGALFDSARRASRAYVAFRAPVAGQP